MRTLFWVLVSAPRLYRSFLPSTILEWNNLPQEAKPSVTVNSFKVCLNKDKQQVPTYYYTGNRSAQILHTRLRTNCSSLNFHLFTKKVYRFTFMSLWEYRKCSTLFFSLSVCIRYNVINDLMKLCHIKILPSICFCMVIHPCREQ